MSVSVVFPYSQFSDGTLTIPLQPPTAIGGWNVRMTCMKRFGGVSGFFVKSMASGFYGVSGMNIVNSGNGTMNATINSADTSGMAYGTYAVVIERMDSGFRTPLSNGFLINTP